MAIGLLAIALMVVYFGRFGDSIRGFYRIRVEYPNASGIYKGASVLLAGAKIGSVENNPVILPEMDGVYVILRIYEEVKIPSAAQFTIGSSGLLGDRFVQIVLGKDAKSSPPLQADAVVKGKGESGIGDVTERAGALLADIQETVGNINKIALKLNSDVFKETTIANLNSTLSEPEGNECIVCRDLQKNRRRGEKGRGSDRDRPANVRFGQECCRRAEKDDHRCPLAGSTSEAGQGSAWRAAFGSGNGREPQGPGRESSPQRYSLVQGPGASEDALTILRFRARR